MKSLIVSVSWVIVFAGFLLLVFGMGTGVLPRTLSVNIWVAVVAFTATFMGLAFLLRDRPPSDADMEGVRWK
ncbi:MAG: hypothetical protein AMDU3_IPLC00004G0004 [Thermoplasmatales archaeon I-plasma]|jgi:hypothetical protein|nr:MAG: hypothetical protein AMDU3_IPLC00004G0004 [Thermoplasmatales archaeon I-plasma]